MAIVALVLWMFTAGAGISLLVRSTLGHTRLADVPPEHKQAAPVPATSPAAPAATAPSASATHSRFDPPSLVASRSAPAVPGARALLEFLHPACAIVGLGFWLGFTLVHARVLGWIAFGLIVVTAGLGLGWFLYSRRAAQRPQRPGRDRAAAAAPVLSFNGRLAAVHGGAAAVTFILAALSALVLKA